jgi:hypothetical protein
MSASQNDPRTWNWLKTLVFCEVGEVLLYEFCRLSHSGLTVRYYITLNQLVHFNPFKPKLV